ncbi:B12-binding domain-containing radical SAM protein [Streptomyces sp. NPDC058665]|uniref:B12-binding domain-containing radical SAM protein n=1 Tax=Streptomyces sp. NPDC058665 TaxID=3346586 RepID=UPI003657D161
MTITSWSPEVLLINPVEGAPGTRGKESAPARYVDTIPPSFLYGLFHHTFPAEPTYYTMLAGQTRAAGLTTELVDGYCHRLDENELTRVVQMFDTPIYCFAIFHNTIEQALRIAKVLKERDPDAVIVFGGAYASPLWKTLVAHEQVDYVVVGDGEISLVELCKAILRDEGDPKKVRGIAWDDGKNGRLTPPAPIMDLDSLAFPVRDLLPLIREYGHGVSMYSSRGCGFAKCSFCYLLPYQAVALQPKWRARSAENVVDEMEYLYREHGVTRVTFVDEDYFGDNGESGVGRALRIAELLIERGIKMNYYVNSLVKSLVFLAKKQEPLDLLARSGLDTVFAGFESTSTNRLKSYTKPQRPEQYGLVISELAKRNIRINLGMITFDPTMSVDELKANVELAEEMRYYDLYFFTRTLVDFEQTPLGASNMSREGYDDLLQIFTRPSSEPSNALPMAASHGSINWYQEVASQHEFVGKRYEDAKVATTFQAMRLYASLLFDVVAPLCASEREIVLAHRDAIIENHFDAFWRCVTWAEQLDEFPSQFDIETWVLSQLPRVHAIFEGEAGTLDWFKRPKELVPGMGWA